MWFDSVKLLNIEIWNENQITKRVIKNCSES